MSADSTFCSVPQLLGAPPYPVEIFRSAALWLQPFRPVKLSSLPPDKAELTSVVFCNEVIGLLGPGQTCKAYWITINRIMTMSYQFTPPKKIIIFWESQMTPWMVLTNDTVIYCNLQVYHSRVSKLHQNCVACTFNLVKTLWQPYTFHGGGFLIYVKYYRKWSIWQFGIKC